MRRPGDRSQPRETRPADGRHDLQGRAPPSPGTRYNRPMDGHSLNPESLRHILGLKLRRFRRERGLGLKEMAKRSGLSISYLSEIEKGRKYPKPEKLLALAQTLGVGFDELVSLEVGDELEPVRDLFTSPFVQQFPWHLFDLELESVLALLVEAPSKAQALLRTAIEIGRTYDLQVEHFLFAALRSYQHLHQNYFADIEEAAAETAAQYGWGDPGEPTVDELTRVLEEEHGVQVDDQSLLEHEELRGLRSVWIDGDVRRVLVNPRLLPVQKAFALGRELGYPRLGLKERSTSSTYLRVESFDQVINDFQAAYFSGALLLPRETLVEDLHAFFGRRQFSAEAFLALLERYRTTPETFFYRLSQIVPKELGLRESFFVRFSHDTASPAGHFHMTKHLDLSRLPIARSRDSTEHFCRRWTGLHILRELAEEQARGNIPVSPKDVRAGAQRAHFLDAERDFFVLSLARPLALSGGTNTSVSLGFLIDRTFKRQVRFWNDPAVPSLEVGVTCEGCPLEDEECEVRAAAPRLLERQAEERRREKALERLIRDASGRS